MSKKRSTEDVIKYAVETHGNNYDYSKTKYVNAKSKILIICPIHGEFEQEANSHLSGHGCQKCNGGVSYTQIDFIEYVKNKKHFQDKCFKNIS